MVLIPSPITDVFQAPITSVRWKPAFVGDAIKSSSVLVSTTSDGIIQHWHTGNKSQIGYDNSCQEIGNEINCSDFTRDGKKFLVAGKDRKVYVFQENSGFNLL